MIILHNYTQKHTYIPSKAYFSNTFRSIHNVIKRTIDSLSLHYIYIPSRAYCNNTFTLIHNFTKRNTPLVISVFILSISKRDLYWVFLGGFLIQLVVIKNALLIWWLILAPYENANSQSLLNVKRKMKLYESSHCGSICEEI